MQTKNISEHLHKIEYDLATIVGNFRTIKSNMVSFASVFTKPVPLVAVKIFELIHAIDNSATSITFAKSLIEKRRLKLLVYRFLSLFSKQINYDEPDLQLFFTIVNQVALDLEMVDEQFKKMLLPIINAVKDGKDDFITLADPIVESLQSSLRILNRVKELANNEKIMGRRNQLSLPHQSWDFIADQSLREILSRDYQELQNLVNTNSHKSIIILCGSILEAALISVLSVQPLASIKYEELYRGKCKGGIVPPFENWKLFELINVAEVIGLLDEDSRIQADILRDYRNLIHPVVEIRRKTKIDLELVITQLSLFKRVLRLLSSHQVSSTTSSSFSS